MGIDLNQKKAKNMNIYIIITLVIILLSHTHVHERIHAHTYTRTREGGHNQLLNSEQNIPISLFCILSHSEALSTHKWYKTIT